MANSEIGLGPKVVLIIGNGFDLGFGLKTKYIDFVRSEYFKPMIDGDLRVIDRFGDYGENEDSMIIYPNKLAEYINNDAEEHNWVDVEADIRNYCKEVGNANEQDRIRKELYSIRYFLFKYFQFVVQHSQINNQLERYVGYEVLKQLTDSNSDYHIWNFNYTALCERLLKELKVEDSVINERHHQIHGSIQECLDKRIPCITLGTCYDPDVMQACPDVIKSNMIEDYQQVKNVFNTDLMEADVLLIFGHSMGDSDSQYFKNVLRTSKKLKLVVNINKNSAAISKGLANLDILSDYTFAQKIENGDIALLKYQTDGYLDMFGFPSEEAKNQLSSILKHALTFSIG